MYIHKLAWQLESRLTDWLRNSNASSFYLQKVLVASHYFPTEGIYQCATAGSFSYEDVLTTRDLLVTGVLARSTLPTVSYTSD